MGAKLAGLYEEAKSLGGLKATMRLAMLTGIPSKNAATIDDSPDTIKKFQDALGQIKKEL